MASSGHHLEGLFVAYMLLSGLLVLITGNLFVPIVFAIVGYPLYATIRSVRKHPDQ